MDEDKLKELVLILDTLATQGFIDSPVKTKFGLNVRQWLTHSGLADLKKEDADEYIIDAWQRTEPIAWLRDICEEILGKKAEKLWQEIIKDIKKNR